jgi:hypothetical protein
MCWIHGKKLRNARGAPGRLILIDGYHDGYHDRYYDGYHLKSMRQPAAVQKAILSGQLYLSPSLFSGRSVPAGGLAAGTMFGLGGGGLADVSAPGSATATKAPADQAGSEESEMTSLWPAVALPNTAPDFWCLPWRRYVTEG